jgi:hypothetical protein
MAVTSFQHRKHRLYGLNSRAVRATPALLLEKLHTILVKSILHFENRKQINQDEWLMQYCVLTQSLYNHVSLMLSKEEEKTQLLGTKHIF